MIVFSLAPSVISARISRATSTSAPIYFDRCRVIPAASRLASRPARSESSCADPWPPIHGGGCGGVPVSAPCVVPAPVAGPCFPGLSGFRDRRQTVSGLCVRRFGIPALLFGGHGGLHNDRAAPARNSGRASAHEAAAPDRLTASFCTGTPGPAGWGLRPPCGSGYGARRWLGTPAWKQGGAPERAPRWPDASGGATRIRTGDRGFADLCLTTWRWRLEGPTPYPGGSPLVKICGAAPHSLP